jgi:phage terminase small subunit
MAKYSDTRTGGKDSARLNRLGVCGLTGKQIRFIDQYMVDRSLRGAAERCGYAGSAPAAKMLRSPVVQKEIERRERERAARVDIQSDDILKELKRIAYFDVRSLWDPETKKLRTDPLDMNEDEARALVNFDIIVLNKDGDHIVALRPGNKIRALELLGKYRKLWTDKVDASVSTTVNFVTDFGTDEEEPAETQ